MTSNRASGRARNPLSELSRGALFLLGLTATAKALALIGLASALASGIVSVIDGTDQWRDAVALGAASALLRAASAWASSVVAARAMLGVKERMRARLVARLLSDGGGGGSAAVLATRGLDELDKYFTVFLPALVTAATVPLLVGARILLADWVSALVIVVTVPLIPVFMVLIGMHTRDGVAEANTRLARLSDHLVELARGLPVLVGLGRAREQAEALRRLSDEHRTTTLATLRIAFLSSLALELIATISVAVVAVFIGVRLVGGDMPLELGLLALLLAPECFRPLREVGTAFHAAEDGQHALSRVRAILTAPRRATLARITGGELRVRALRVRYAGRNDDAVGPLDFAVRPRGVTLLDGPSGAGKSTVLSALAGVLHAADGTLLEGEISGVHAGRVAWLAQHPRTVSDSVERELALYAGEAPDATARVSEAIARLGLGAVATAEPASLSPGELRRLAVGRVLLRALGGAELVLLDEPTAHLDPESAERVLEIIEVLALSCAVVVASHDPAVRSLADAVVPLGAARSGSIAERAVARPSTQARRTAPAELPEGSALRGLIDLLRPVAGRTIGAISLGILAASFAVGLTAVSAWLIVRASEQPPIMYLLVAIVGVRFFGIGRAVLRYCERLVGHDAVFASLTELRQRLWSGLSAEGAARRTLVTGASVLDRLVRDVDRVRDLAIRVVLPIAVGVTTMIVAVVVVAFVHPPAVPLFVALALVALIAAPAVALLADGASARADEMLRSRVLRRITALLGASDDVRANGVDAAVRDELATLDRAATSASLRGAWAQGLGSAIVVAACCLSAVLVLPLTAESTPAPGLVAVLALVPLGLIEPILELVGAVRQAPALRALLRRTAGLDIAPLDVADDAQDGVTAKVLSLELDGVSARWPGASADVFKAVSASVGTGEWLVITGPSGAGKSTLLTVLLGGLPASRGRISLGGRDAGELGTRELRRRMAWCPQEGYLFDSTLRANLLIARNRDDAPDDAELIDVLRLVGLGGLLGRLEHGLDTRIGSAGAALSGGERQRLAVARTLLTRSEVILLDEPTAHLDEEGAAELMADLRNALREHITVLVTHQANDLLPSDVVVRLGEADAAMVPRESVGAPA